MGTEDWGGRLDWAKVLAVVEAVSECGPNADVGWACARGVGDLLGLEAVDWCVEPPTDPTELARLLRCGTGGVLLPRPPTVAERTAVAPILRQTSRVLEVAGNYAELDQLVQREMQTSVEREEAMRLVLDSMQEGLLECRPDGSLTNVLSRAVLEWFGAPLQDGKVWSYLGSCDPTFALRFEVGFFQLVEDVLPFDLSAGQMPQYLARDDRTFGFSYRQVQGGEGGVLVCIRDATAEFKAQRVDREARELATTVEHLLEDREGFVAFVTDMDRMLRLLADPAHGPSIGRVLSQGCCIR